jgi:hypothetical protein
MPLAKDTDLRDGTLRGVTGPLVKIPVNAIPFATSGPANTIGSNPFNTDGSTGNLPLSVTAGLPGIVWITTRLAGSVIGTRWRSDSGAVTVGYDVIIDGVAFPVDATNPRFHNIAQSITDYETSHIVATGLENRTHTVTVAIPADVTGGSTRTLNFLGWSVEQGRGYNVVQPTPRGGYVPAPATLTTSSVSIPYSTPVAGLSFHNGDSVTRLVTVYGPDGTSIYRLISLAAGADAQITFPSPRVLSGWKWKSDAASVVLGWTENA